MAIVGSQEHQHAARRLRAGISPEALGRRDIRLTLDRKLPEGAFSIALEGGSVTIRGGPFSGVIYGAEELIRLGGRNCDTTAIAEAPVTGAPGLAYRTFWTWDHSTNWELSQVGQQEIGVFNPYQKPPSGFLADYQRLVDFCSRNRIAAVVIYGFLRDSHGGVETAQELCRYANERGVRIVPGIAIGAYGGVYWEGNHPYNLAHWLKKNPQHAAKMEKDVGFQIADLSFPLNFPHSDYTVSACPSAVETMDWMEEAVGWLAETFEIGGVNIESGDYGVCGCARCVARRANDAEAARRKGEFGDSWSHTDMATNFPRLFRAANAKRDDLWIYCEMQWDNLLDPVALQAQTGLPNGAIYQYTANRSYWAKIRDTVDANDVAGLPTQPNVLRCQFACQWNGDERTERYAFNARTFADMASVGNKMGMKGLTVWGEPSDYIATTELSYLAFARFCWDTELTWERFVSESVAPLLGDVDAANAFIAIAEELDSRQVLSTERLDALFKQSLFGVSNKEHAVARRWLSLSDRIARRRHMGR